MMQLSIALLAVPLWRQALAARAKARRPVEDVDVRDSDDVWFVVLRVEGVVELFRISEAFE